MSATVFLPQMIEELEAQDDDEMAYLNRETGEFFVLREEDARLVEDGAVRDDLPEWQRDQLPKMREVLESAEWLPLPTRFDVHEWAIMDGFARSIEDADLRDELLNSIRGSGAFRCFKDTLHRYGIQEPWYRYRTEALARIAVEWLEQHGIPYALDAGVEPAG